VNGYVSSNSGYPGSRSSHKTVVIDNTLIIFGGYGYSIGILSITDNNEMWSFDSIVNQWDFMSGNMSVNPIGLYSKTGNGYIGSRDSHSMSLLVNNSVIIVGGNGYISKGIGYLNDMWRINLCHLCEYGTCWSNNFDTGYCSFCEVDYYGLSCNESCQCVNGTCSNGVGGTGLCLTCEVNYFGTDCNQLCSCPGACFDGIDGDGSCYNSTDSPTSSSASNPTSSSASNPTGSSSNSPTSSQTSKSPSTSSKVNTESSQVPFLKVSIFFSIVTLLLIN